MPAHSTKSKHERRKKSGRAAWDQMHERRENIKKITGKDWKPLRIRKNSLITDETQTSRYKTGRQEYSSDILETKERWDSLMYSYCNKEKFSNPDDCTEYCTIGYFCDGYKEPKFGYDNQMTKSILDQKGL